MGRDTHQRVRNLNKLLKAHNIVTWFDEEQMLGQIRAQMQKGIEESAVVLVCLTNAYARRVDGPNAADNCQLEFQYAMSTKSQGLLLPLAMEPLDPVTWSESLGFLKKNLYRHLIEDDASVVETLVYDILHLIRVHNLALEPGMRTWNQG
eukprot:CAMPEP_0181292908 /NCGR_PEP_ID=MMETSP1101-20121128/2770_1 /TAXON_ID=46948 /ORGANISM="Rhodomonas abbreviata, Strain Caron Lab Isolate" /LENGTH=149 /DNA_ID=CAMNT_0023397435 /DNA_START=531 /DNA_END=980 /DNA_ORIENTATION=-